MMVTPVFKIAPGIYALSDLLINNAKQHNVQKIRVSKPEAPDW